MRKYLRTIALALVAALGTSCTTTYDSYGNTRQSIDPAGAAVGAVALGALAYSVGKSRGERRERRRQNFHNGFYDPRWDGGGGRFDPYCR